MQNELIGMLPINFYLRANLLYVQKLTFWVWLCDKDDQNGGEEKYVMRYGLENILVIWWLQEIFTVVSKNARLDFEKVDLNYRKLIEKQKHHKTVDILENWNFPVYFAIGSKQYP